MNDLSAVFGAFARDLVRPEPDRDRAALGVLLATVTAVHATTPPTVDVDLAGGTVSALRYPVGYSPTAGDDVWVLTRGGAALFVAVVLA